MSIVRWDPFRELEDTNIDENKVTAEYKDGALTVRLPKAPNAKPKTVDVKIA